MGGGEDDPGSTVGSPARPRVPTTFRLWRQVQRGRWLGFCLRGAGEARVAGDCRVLWSRLLVCVCSSCLPCRSEHPAQAPDFVPGLLLPSFLTYDIKGSRRFPAWAPPAPPTKSS